MQQDTRQKRLRRPIFTDKIETKEREEMNTQILTVRDYQEQIVQSEIKKIKFYIKQREDEIGKFLKNSKKAKEIEEINGLSIFTINKYLFCPLIPNTGIINKYTETELLAVLDFYADKLEEVNKITVCPAQLETYCRLLGISTNRFKSDYLKSNFDSLRNAAQQVIDFVSSSLSFGGMTRTFDNTSQIFAQKTTLGRNDKSGDDNKPQNNVLIVTPEQIQQQISEIIKKTE